MIEVLKQTMEALERSVATCFDQYAHQQVMSQPDHFINQAITSLRQAIAEAEKQEPKRLWLWKNFVDGRPEYWAFDNPYPCVSAQGDPLTLGEPCGWAFLKPSVNGRPDRSEQEVINTVTRLAAHGIKENT